MISIETKHFKELEIILSDFNCDKNCPYCTAKITKWPVNQDDIHMLSLYVGQLKKLGYTFHYVTIGGNGEPTLHDYKKLKEIVELFDDYDGIVVKRILTSGNVFREIERAKYNLFVEHDWLFEVTTTSFDTDKDMKTLGYNHNYFITEAFKNSRIRLNYVLLNQNYDVFIDDLKKFAKTYDNIETLAVKLLNINTKTGLIDNPLSEWISKNGVSKEKREEIADILNKNFVYKGESFDTHSWELDDKHEVYFSWKKVNYGLYDLVYYGDRFINYQLEDVNLTHLVPKVYIASRFIKEKKDNGSFSFCNDFRSQLIGTEEDFVNFNNHSFIVDKDGAIKYQYLGPFYNEKASDGSLTSTICDEVVRTENTLIDKCDVFIAYLDKDLSPGSISELIYAAFKGKKIIIYYEREDSISYELKSSNWYPIVTVKQLVGEENIEVYCVENSSMVMDIIQK